MPSIIQTTTALLDRLSNTHTSRIDHHKGLTFWINLHSRLCTDLQNDRDNLVSLHSQHKENAITTAEFNARGRTTQHRIYSSEEELVWLRQKMFNAMNKRCEAEGEVDMVLEELNQCIEGAKAAILGGAKDDLHGDEVENTIVKYDSLEQAVKSAEEVERLVKLQYSIAETELQYAEEVEIAHWRMWKAERILELGTWERDLARTSFEMARQKFRVADRRLAEADHARLEAIIARLEAESAVAEEGGSGKKLKGTMDGILSIVAGDIVN